MLKINKLWVIISLVLWLFACQGLFILVQRSSAEKIVTSIQNQMRQELKFSDFHFMARNISDYTITGAIRCTVLEKIKPEYIAVVDLKYMGTNCHSNQLFLNGSSFDIDLKTLNGDIYRLRFISNNSQLFYLALWGFRVLGIVLVLSVVWGISLKLQKDMLKYQLELDYISKVNDIAMQVSHDIRSPLAALKVAVEEINILDIEYKNIVMSALGRIDEIANNLLGKNIADREIVLSEERLIPLLESIISEKKMEFKAKNDLSIELNIPNNLGPLLVKVSSLEFKRLVSNLINNSVEAIPPSAIGKISIELSLKDDHWVSIAIEDNGKGIPLKILDKLGEKGVTYGKEENIKSGSGLGLNHAKNMILKFQGRFDINSVEGKGTKINIELPICSHSHNDASESQCESQFVSKCYDCVLIDNDELVRITWQAKAKRKNISILTLQSVKEFSTFEDKIDKLNTAIYIDCDLGDGEISGVEFAELLYNKGFSNLNMATGYGQDKFQHLPWLKYSGKAFPF